MIEVLGGFAITGIILGLFIVVCGRVNDLNSEIEEQHKSALE